jgi:glucosamine--fructose-6-phosphate aminotransferase (isomerizing)
MEARGYGTAAVASDPTALAGLCAEYTALNDGDIAELSRAGVTITTATATPDRHWTPITAGEDTAGDDTAGLGHFATHTRAEIAAQPDALRRTEAGLVGRPLTPAIAAAERLVIVACGSSLYAASTARAWIEALTGLPVDLEIASEFRTRNAPLSPRTVAILVSQSGETADTLAVQQMFRAAAIPCVAVVNVAHSQMARDAELVWPTSAGRETGVAATKSFTCQLLALVHFGLALGEARATVPAETRARLEAELASLPAICAATEHLEPELKAVAQRIAFENEAMFIGRGPAAAIAAEGALKLKELSYIRADAYAAGELKHGPIALIRENSPVIVCAGEHAEKTLANAEEVRSRGAAVIALAGAADAARFQAISAETVVLPGTGLALVFAQAVAVQLIAVHAAEALGCDVDRPRNLAKSVTVE